MSDCGSPANVGSMEWLGLEPSVNDDEPHTFGSIMHAALEAIATMPLEEKDNMMAANMRHVARTALGCRPVVFGPGDPIPNYEQSTLAQDWDEKNPSVDMNAGLGGC